MEAGYATIAKVNVTISMKNAVQLILLAFDLHDGCRRRLPKVSAPGLSSPKLMPKRSKPHAKTDNHHQRRQLLELEVDLSRGDLENLRAVL